jgi:hypothetical protein
MQNISGRVMGYDFKNKGKPDLSDAAINPIAVA